MSPRTECVVRPLQEAQLTHVRYFQYLLSGPINKAVSKNGTTSLVDIYGTLVASRLFVPSDLSQLSSKHLKLSSQRSRVDAGDFPLPIYCAIRHNVPEMSRVAELEKKRAEMAVERDPKQEEQKRAKEAKEEELKKERDDILKRQSYQVRCRRPAARWLDKLILARSGSRRRHLSSAAKTWAPGSPPGRSVGSSKTDATSNRNPN